MLVLNTPQETYNYVKQIARKSTCLDRKVGCVIVDRAGEVVATGYNRTECTRKCAKFDGKACPARHAEKEAVCSLENEKIVRRLINRGFEFKELTAYVSYQPCKHCVKALEEAGVTHIIFYEESEQDVPEFSGRIGQQPFMCSYKTMLPLLGVRGYHKLLGYPNELCDKETQFMQAREILLAMQLEVSEVAESIQWKPWRKARNYCRYNMLEELSDVLFFMDSLLMNFGCTWEDLAEVMQDKLEECHNRIKRGYHE